MRLILVRRREIEVLKEKIKFSEAKSHGHNIYELYH